ncbi:MAG TPA: hypothetical protein VFD27_15990 [Chthoniobacteraceae bacterium]|nr:hypothetical protein [Chthoniobacteraceae bacterium]
MKLPRDLSGAELIKLLCKHFGYRRVNPRREATSFSKPPILASIELPFRTTLRCELVL